MSHVLTVPVNTRESRELLYVMEYLPRGCLSEHLKKCKINNCPESEDRKLKFLIDVAKVCCSGHIGFGVSIVGDSSGYVNLVSSLTCKIIIPNSIVYYI